MKHKNRNEWLDWSMGVCFGVMVGSVIGIFITQQRYWPWISMGAFVINTVLMMLPRQKVAMSR